VTIEFLPNTGCALSSPARRTVFCWHGRAAISVDNMKPRMTSLNAYYAKSSEEGVATDE
jgi:hypothetical protein